MSTYGTPFVESEAILAAQQYDNDTLFRLVEDMLPNERASLRGACRRLMGAIDAANVEDRQRDALAALKRGHV